ncbi:NlpC/P60 family protein [Christensenellaceae bacterium OttesenSCG-928-L17]|nr:NlpC/P60 family protein [Christensenellaceae bacterium OttesenSCG-928-L17]
MPKKAFLFVLAVILLCVPAVACAASEPPAASITDFERQIVEQGFRLLPEDHPFVVAYENTYGVEINSFSIEIDGTSISGVPYEYGGKYMKKGFSPSWWAPTITARYPVTGLDCSGYVAWVYAQVGYQIPISSSSQFFAGKSGVVRSIEGLPDHLVIPSLDDAMIGDVAYNTTDYTYTSGKSSHIQLYLGTANKLGIAAELKKLIPKFPCDAHLVLDCGWSDGAYYFKSMRSLRTPGARRDMGGVGVQFFTSIKAGSKYIYRAPTKTFKWKNKSTGNTFYIDSYLNKEKRYLQHNPRKKIEYPMNLSRPIVRPDR